MELCVLVIFISCRYLCLTILPNDDKRLWTDSIKKKLFIVLRSIYKIGKCALSKKRHDCECGPNVKLRCGFFPIQSSNQTTDPYN